MQSWALIDFEDAVYPELAPSGRALAMGNAYICKTDDAASAMYNPAGLGTVRNTHLHLNNFFLETNRGYLRLGGNKATDVVTNTMGKLSFNGTRKLLLNSKGTIAHSRFHVLPNFTMRYFSVGFLYAQRSRSTIGTQPNAKFEYAHRQDYGPYGALNLSLFGGIFKIGWTSVLLTRKQVNNESDANLGIVLSDNEYMKGTMTYHIAGARLTIPWVFLPTFAATMHNALDGDFAGQSDAGPPPKTPRNLVLGFSITPQIASTVRVHLEVNWKDFLINYPEVPAYRKLVFGTEIDFGRKAFLRFGYSDGFGSTGIGFKSQAVEMDLTTYAVDTTTKEWRGKEDRRFVINFSASIL